MSSAIPLGSGNAIGAFIQSRPFRIGLPVCLMALLAMVAVIAFPVSDESEAYSDVPVLDVRTADGKSISGVGAILDGAELDFVVMTAPNTPETFLVAEDTVLVSGQNYLILTNSDPIGFSLSGYMFGSNTFVKEYGLRLSLHKDPSCSDTPVASAEFFDNTVYIMSEDLRSGTPYYIRVATVKEIVFDKAPNAAGIGFGFDAATESDCNAVHFHSDDKIVGSTLFRNGERFVFPEITKEGCTLIGWMSEPDGGTVYQPTDTVDIDRDIDLYAFWWSGGSENVHYETLDGSKIDITAEVSDRVLITVHAESADKRITVDLKEADAAQLRIPVTFSVGLSDEGDSLTAADAETCMSMTGLIDAWFASRGLEPQLHIVPDSAGTVEAEIEALRVLGKGNVSMDIVSHDARMILDPEALDSLFRQAVPIATGTDGSAIDYDSEIPGLEGKTCGFIIRPAEDSDLTSDQKNRVGSSDAWYAAVRVGDETITELEKGKVTLVFPHKADSAAEVTVYHLAHDGTKTPCKADYDGSNATVESSELSVFMIEDRDREAHKYGFTLGLSIALVVFTVAYIGMRIHRH